MKRFNLSIEACLSNILWLNYCVKSHLQGTEKVQDSHDFKWLTYFAIVTNRPVFLSKKSGSIYPFVWFFEKKHEQWLTPALYYLINLYIYDFVIRKKHKKRAQVFIRLEYLCFIPIHYISKHWPNVVGELEIIDLNSKSER